VEQLQLQREKSEAEEERRQRPQQTGNDLETRVKQGLLLFEEELPDESERIRQETNEGIRAKRRKCNDMLVRGKV
jgi:hypothetical protein